MYDNQNTEVNETLSNKLFSDRKIKFGLFLFLYHGFLIKQVQHTFGLSLGCSQTIILAFNSSVFSTCYLRNYKVLSCGFKSPPNVQY